MNEQTVIDLASKTIWVTIQIAAPALLAALAAGLIVSIFQAATQINEATLSFIPKLIGVFLVLLIVGPWMLTTLVDYMHMVFTSIPAMAN